MTAEEYAAWEQSPAEVTMMDSAQYIMGVNVHEGSTDSNWISWATKAQLAESFDGVWDSTLTSVWDSRIVAGDTITGKFINLGDGSVLAEGSYTLPGGEVAPDSATSGLAGALAGLVACISLFIF